MRSCGARLLASWPPNAQKLCLSPLRGHPLLLPLWERAFALIRRPPRPPCPTFVVAAWKPGQPASLPVLGRPGGEPPSSRTARKAQPGWFGLCGAVNQSANQSASKSCCAWARRAGSAQGTVPSALPGSIITLGTFSHPPDALTCRPQRGQAASTGRGGAPEAVKTQFWPAVMAPRRTGLSADDAAASHRAADGAVPSIEAARTRAHGTTRGAVAVSRTFCPRSLPFQRF
jgi:hypothetical protein